MKKIAQSLGEHFRPVKLYLDDIEKIIETLSQVSSKVSISTEDYALDDAQQLASLKQEQITYLHISLHEPYISLELKPSNIWLFAAEDEPISRGLFEKIKQILLKRERKFARIVHNGSLMGLLIGASLVLLVWGIAVSNILIIFVSIAWLILSVAFTWYGYQDQFKKYSIIIPKYEINAPSFWKRNSDKILLMILSAIFGGLVSLVLLKVFGKAP